MLRNGQPVGGGTAGLVGAMLGGLGSVVPATGEATCVGREVSRVIESYVVFLRAPKYLRCGMLVVGSSSLFVCLCLVPSRVVHCQELSKSILLGSDDDMVRDETRRDKRRDVHANIR